MDKYVVAKRIKDKREQMHLKQVDVQRIGGTKVNLSAIESATYYPGAEALVALSKAFDCSINWILTGKEFHKENSDILNQIESELLNYFRTMSEDDKDELLMIAKMKADKVKREKNVG